MALAHLLLLLLLLLPTVNLAFRIAANPCISFQRPSLGCVRMSNSANRRCKLPLVCSANKAEFDIQLAQRLATLCEASYRRLKPGRSIVGANLVEQRELPNGAGYFIAKDPSALYVVFRGTANVDNVISDLNAVLVELPWLKPEASSGAGFGKGHAGFVDLYLSIRQHVLDATLQAHAAADSLDIFITGHSLGGAVATLFAADVAVHQPQLVPKLSMYSFGSPRVGDMTFAAAFDRDILRSFRCRNQCDIVTRLPLWSILYKYKHIGKEVVFQKQEDSFDDDGPSDADPSGWAWEVEPPKYMELTPKQLMEKFIAYPHLSQLDLQHHIHYLDSKFPKNPFGDVDIRSEIDELNAEILALINGNRALTAENERKVNDDVKTQIDDYSNEGTK